MKKLAVILLGAGLLLTACQQKDLETSPASNGNVTITVLANDAISVRSNSANGGITNMGSDYYLRYVLYIYDADTNEEVCTDLATVSSYSDPYTFNEELPDMENCYAVVWADFVDNADGDDYHYDTSNFPEIDCSAAALNDESYDAFYGYKEFAVTGANVNVTLKRPFAKLRLVTTDWDNNNAPDEITLTYSEGRYTSFNALTGEASSQGSVVEFTGDIDPDAYDAGLDATTGYRTLAVDYILVNDEQTTVNLAYTASQNGTEFHSLLISQDIPLQRNYLTTVMGNLLTDTDSFNFNIGIDEDFESETIVMAGHFTVDPAQLIEVDDEEYYYVNVGEEVTLTPVVDGAEDSWTWTWTSDDESVATVEDGVVKGVDKGLVTITASYTSGSTIYTCSGVLYVQKIVTGGVKIAETAVTLSIDASYTVDVEVPDDSEQTLTWEVDEDGQSVLSVDEDGTVTFLAPGEATITVTSDADELVDDYSQSATVTVTVPYGWYDETFETEAANWDFSQYATSYIWTEDATGNYYSVTTSTAGRGDIAHSNTSYLDNENYPIVCIRIDDVNDTDGYTRNINFNLSGTDSDNNTVKGNCNGNNNKWTTKYVCSDDSAILVYNLTDTFTDGSTEYSFTGTFSGTMSIKYADIKNGSDAAQATFRFFWFKTFASTTEMESYLSEWSTESGITYEEE